MNTYTDENVALELSRSIDEKIISDMSIIADELGGRLPKLPKEAIDTLFHILIIGGYPDMKSTCDQVLGVLGYSTEELPLHVNDGGIVEAATVWRLRHGI